MMPIQFAAMAHMAATAGKTGISASAAQVAAQQLLLNQMMNQTGATGTGAGSISPQIMAMQQAFAMQQQMQQQQQGIAGDALSEHAGLPARLQAIIPNGMPSNSMTPPVGVPAATPKQGGTGRPRGRPPKNSKPRTT